jgi:hypothetical protein
MRPCFALFCAALAGACGGRSEQDGKPPADERSGSAPHYESGLESSGEEGPGNASAWSRPGSDPSLAVDESGQALVVWRTASAVVATQRDAAGTWSSVFELQSIAGVSLVGPAAAAGGNLMALYATSSGTLMASYYDAELGWAASQAIALPSEPLAGDEGLSVSLNASGEALVAWSDHWIHAATFDRIAGFSAASNLEPEYEESRDVYSSSHPAAKIVDGAAASVAWLRRSTQNEDAPAFPSSWSTVFSRREQSGWEDLSTRSENSMTTVSVHDPLVTRTRVGTAYAFTLLEDTLLSSHVAAHPQSGWVSWQDWEAAASVEQHQTQLGFDGVVLLGAETSAEGETVLFFSTQSEPLDSCQVELRAVRSADGLLWSEPEILMQGAIEPTRVASNASGEIAIAGYDREPGTDGCRRRGAWLRRLAEEDVETLAQTGDETIADLVLGVSGDGSLLAAWTVAERVFFESFDAAR